MVDCIFLASYHQDMSLQMMVVVKYHDENKIIQSISIHLIFRMFHICGFENCSHLTVLMPKITMIGM